MGALGESLVLLHDATQHYRSLAGEVRHWQDSALKREAVDRYIADGGSASTPRPQEDEAAWEVVRRLVVSLPGRLREEREVTAGAPGGWGITLLVVDGDRWMIHIPRSGAFEGSGRPHASFTMTPVAPLLDPREVAVWVDLEVTGTATVAGRPGIRLRGTPRPPRATKPFNWGYDMWVRGATVHDLVVDADRGVLLRTAAMLGDDEFDVKEFLGIAFDAEPAPSAFVFVAPDGQPVRPSPTETRPLSPEECRHIGAFRAWLPTSLDQVQHLRWQEPWDRDGKPELYLRSYLERGFVDLVQSQASSPLLVGPGYSALELHGTTAYLWEDQFGYSCLAFELSGTELRLRGDVDVDDMVAFASTLRPASEVVG